MDLKNIDKPPPSSFKDNADLDKPPVKIFEISGDNQQEHLKNHGFLHWLKSDSFHWTTIKVGFCSCLIYFGLLVVSIYMLIMQNNFTSSTIYTQAIGDWSARSWVDFTWSSTGKCPLGYEAIGNTWAGTFPFNATDNILGIVNSAGFYDDYAVDYAAIPAKM